MPPPSIMLAVARGLRTRCPRCGRGSLYGRGLRLRGRCADCGLELGRYAHDTWAMIYFSTAALTGAVVIALIVARPSNLLLGRFVLGAVALAVIVASLPSRKGAAIAVNWLVAARGGEDEEAVPSSERDC